MRDQLNNRSGELNENLSALSESDIMQTHYPIWDKEELDLSARYKKVNIIDQEIDQPQRKKSNFYKPYRNE